jgi:4-amino-4-deoxy-L-arabinose transferase-like glycosyltransferase
MEPISPGTSSIVTARTRHEMSAMRISRGLLAALLFGLLPGLVAIGCYTMQARTLVPTDEARYAEIAREMAETGDFVTPRLNGIKYLEKPPLQAWATALAFRAFGVGEWQARLWTSLCGLFGVAIVMLAGRRLFGARIGLIAGMVLGSSFYWAVASQVNSLDMGLAAMMTLALAAFLLAQRNDASRREQGNWMLVCWVGLALAVLSKGLAGIVLPGAVVLLYALLLRDMAILRRLHAGIGLPVFIAIIAPWFVLVSLRNPEFPYFFFIQEHLQRFTSHMHRREGPWHYFVPILIAGAMPWTGILAQSLRDAWRSDSTGFQPKKLLLIWSIFIFVFFSASGSKLPSYILPVFPALALLMACYVERISERAAMLAASVLVVCGAVGLIAVPKISALAKNTFEIALYQSYGRWIAVAAAIALAGGLVGMYIVRRNRQWGLFILGATGFLSCYAILLGHDSLGRYKAGVDHVPAILAELTPQTPIYAVGLYEQALPFYLRRTLILVEQPDELAFGLRQEPQLWLPTLDQFVDGWSARHAEGKPAIAIMRADVYADLRRRGLPMRVIGADPRRIIVSNNRMWNPMQNELRVDRNREAP